MEKYTYFDFNSHRTGLTGVEFLFWLKCYLVDDQLGVNPNSSSPYMKRLLEEILVKHSPKFRHELNEYRQNLVRQYRRNKVLNETYSDIVKIFDELMRKGEE